MEARQDPKMGSKSRGSRVEQVHEKRATVKKIRGGQRTGDQRFGADSMPFSPPLKDNCRSLGVDRA